MNKWAFFVAATGQNIGKTTTCLGLFAGLRKRFSSVGFFKPVGQESVEAEGRVRVDKDVVLFKSHFQIFDLVEEMSPVLIPKGFTRQVLDGQIDGDDLRQKIDRSFHSILEKHNMTIVEGTGHTGVGSIMELNNAQVAARLKIPLLLIASGGLGSSFDDLSLNYSQCEKYGVRVAGVILNRVLEDKREMVSHYMQLALRRWHIPLLGCIPYDPFLSTPTMYDFELLFQTELCTGKKHRLCHFQQISLIASASEIDRATVGSNQLFITPADREDVVLALLMKVWDVKIAKRDEDCVVGVILTGKKAPKKRLITQIQRAELPMLYVPTSSFIALKMIHSHTTKIRECDTAKIEEAIQVVENHIDFKALCEAIATK